MKISLYVLSFLMVTIGVQGNPSLLSEEEFSAQENAFTSDIVVPKKVIKHLLCVKDTISPECQAVMPGFRALANVLNAGDRMIAADILYGGLAEIEHYFTAFPENDSEDKHIITAYTQKFKRHLNYEAPDFITKSLASNAVPCPPSCIHEGTPGIDATVQDINTPLTITNTTESDDPFTGALTVMGGVGITDKLNVQGEVHIFDTQPSIDSAHGALVVDGGVGIKQNLNVGGPVTIADPTESTNTKSGALVVTGGEAVGGDLNVAGQVHVSNVQQSTKFDNGAVVIDGGIGVAKNANIAGQVHIVNTTESTNCHTGSLIVDGGEGVGGDLNVCGKEHIFDRTNSTACNNGALVVDGGMGVGEDVHICGNLDVLGFINTDSVFKIRGSTVVTTVQGNCNLSVGDNSNPPANGTSNTAIGESAMQNNQIGDSNTALGCEAEKLGIDGSYNTSLGNAASYSNIDGSNNTSTGYQALYSNVVNENTAVGSYALHDNTFGIQNTAIGYCALQKNIGFDINVFGQAFQIFGSNNTAGGHSALLNGVFGASNTAFGDHALYYNGIGSSVGNFFGHYNTAVGASALFTNIAGNYNTACGNDALFANVLGQWNVAVGADAESGNTLGIANTACGTYALAADQASFNTACGYQAAVGNLEGYLNTAVGYNSTQQNLVGFYNTAIGARSLENCGVIIFNNTAGGYKSMFKQEGDDNTAFGANALANQLVGFRNVAIGAGALTNNLTPQSTTAIGALTVSEGSGNFVGGFTAECLGVDSIVIGRFAQTIGDQNIIIGSQAQSLVPTASACIIIGALSSISGGFPFNTLIGHDSIMDGVGIQNISIGTFSQMFGGIQNVAVGCKTYSAGAGKNVLVGDSAKAYVSEGGIAIGSNSYTTGIQNIAIGQDCSSSGDGTIVMGPNSVNFGVANICIGNGMSPLTSVTTPYSIFIGKSAFEKTISIGYSFPFPGSIHIGDTWPDNIACYLGGVAPGPSPLNIVLCFDPAIGEVTWAPLGLLCPYCAVGGPISDEWEIFEDEEVRCEGFEKLMMIEPVAYRVPDSSVGLEFGLDIEQVAETCPELITSSQDGWRYVKEDRLILMILQQVQKHQRTLQDQQKQLALQQQDIEQLQKQNNELRTLIQAKTLKERVASGSLA